MTSDKVISWVIGGTWDGRPLLPGEQVHVALASRGADLELRVDAPFHDDPAPPQPKGALWRLWEHEVVELFLLGAKDHYTEIEIGPHGHYLVVHLEGERNVVNRELSLDLETRIEGSRWTATARVPRAWVPVGPHRANAYSIHGEDSNRRYLAAYPVPGEEPDFHRLHCFEPVDIPR